MLFSQGFTDETNVPGDPFFEEEDDYPESAQFGMGGVVGAITIGNETYSQIRLQPQIKLGKFGFGLDVDLLIDANGNIRREDWDEWQDFVNKIYYVSYARKKDPFFFKIGSIPDYTLGHGLIFDHYCNMLRYPTEKNVGAYVGINTPISGLGFEVYTHNIHKNEILAARVHANPLDITDIPLLRNLKIGINAGIDIDVFAPRLSFFWAEGMNYFMEIAKLRGARVLWAKIIKDFNPKNPKSMALRTHSQTSGWSLTEQDPYNNITRTTIEALAATMGHTQSLHTNSLDEAIALPTDFSARIARNTQLYLQHETGVCKVIDPWAGSYYVESLTDSLMHKAWDHIMEVEKLGGMAKAIETGLPKMRIEEASARRQARIDSGADVIVGVNKYRLETETAMDILEVDNSAVRTSQLARLAKLRKERNSNEVTASLAALTKCAETREGNLLELAIDAARKRASLGEISDALEKVYGRHKATIRLINNVYSSEYANMDDIEKVRALTDKFAEQEGRRPRILIAKMGQDGHDRGAKVVATAFADMGFDVDMGPLFQTPEETARQAVENDVHVIGMSSLAAGHKTLLPQLMEELKKHGREDIMVIVGGVIPAQDYDYLYQHGASAIFGPGTKLPESATTIMETLLVH